MKASARENQKKQDHRKEPVDEEKVQTSMPSIPSDLICEDDLIPISNYLNLSSNADDAFMSFTLMEVMAK